MTANLEANAAPHLSFYYGTVTERRSAWISRIVANCQHHHRTREAAERCGARLLRDLAKSA